MSTATGPNPATGRVALAVLFAIAALVFLAAGITMAVEPASALPGFLGHLHGSTGHHPLRSVGCLLVGAVFAVAAWFALKYRPPTDGHQEAAPAAKDPSTSGDPITGNG
ncbi:MAG: hypothetical protein J2P25_05220 [Nocardiopsaceae bacterium]|nr:hypothetical protein [Nocardiopsaceae bacterium]